MNIWINKLLDKKNVFKNITLQDKNLYEKYIVDSEYEANVWGGNFTYLWSHNFSKNLTIYKTMINDMLTTFILTKRGRLFLPCLPFGKGNPDKVLNVLIKCGNICSNWNKESKYLHKSLVNPVNTPQLTFLKQAKLYNKHFSTEKLSGIERHYSIPKLVNLSGKEFSKVRNRLNKFNKTYSNSIIRKYENNDFSEVMNLGRLWEKTSGKKYKRIIDGFYFEPIIKYSKELNHIILVIELNNKIIGINTAEILSTGNGWGCITKFDNNYSGLSEKLTIEMAKEIYKKSPHVKTINVGSDLGSKGLSFFKERFRPVLNYERFALFYR